MDLTLSEEQRQIASSVEQLLAPHLVSEDEEQGRKVRGPGLPNHLDPKDTRWTSTDCIEPPPIGN